MFRNFLRIALRNLWKNKSYVIINTLGLGIALACCITAYLVLAFNIEFDEHIDDEQVSGLFRVHTDFNSPNGTLAMHISAPLAMGPAMLQDFAGIEQQTRYVFNQGFVRYEEKSFNEGVFFADSVLFDMLPFKVLKGNIRSFKNLNTVILEETTAEKYFPSEDPVGKVLTFNFPNQTEIKAVVGAVTAKVPVNSSVSFHMLMRIEHFMDIYSLSNSEWGDWRDPGILVSLKDPKQAVKYPGLFDQYVPLRNKLKEDAKVVSFHLEPFKKPVSQDEVYWSQFNVRMSAMPIIVFVSMAVMILLIACFNLTNTTIATTARRFKEVGIRKVTGASRLQIIMQFMFEMAITILLSLIAGLIIAPFIIEEFADMWNLQYDFSDLNGLNLLIALLSLGFVASMVAGLYPALKNSGFQPVYLLRGKVRIKGHNFVTRILVAMQFALSVIVLINGIVFIQNTKFQDGIDYGFALDEVLTVFIQDESEYKILNSRVTADPRVINTAISHHQLGMSSYPFPVKVDNEEYQTQHIEVGERFFETMDMQLVEGRFIDFNRATDEIGAIVVNEEFIKHTGIKDPLNAYVHVRDQKRKVVGVVKNHIDNLFRSSKPEPFAFYPSKRNEYQIMLVKGQKEDLPAIKTAVEEIWKEEFPNKPFQAELQDELTRGELRHTNTNLKKIFIFLTILGGLLSATGIFALASLNVEKRTKEIGIRKALGGSVVHILRLLSREFAFILGFAALIGCGGGYYLSKLLMDSIYALHVPIGLFPLIMAAVVIVLVGLISTGFTILRAARANPVRSLRYE